MKDPYVYKNSEILKNKFEIKNEESFKEMEADYTSMRIKELVVNPIKGEYDFKHFLSIHEYIFQDIFEWAGEIREIDIEKGEKSLKGISIEYEKHENVEKAVREVLEKMNERNWNEMEIEKRAKYFSLDMAELWKIHSFRDGNTRTVAIFCTDFLESKGLPLDTFLFENHSTYVRNALVAASAYFSDIGNLSKPEYLINIVKDSMERASIKKHQ